MRKAFILIGHSNWGKSKTLKSLIGSVRVTHWTIKGVDFFVRRISNDDDEESLINFVDKRTVNKGNIIITFCPSFDKGKQVEAILKKLKKDFSLHFFVLKHKYRSDEIIPDTEVAVLKKYGSVYVYPKDTEAAERARAFKAFIADNL
ncbi:MAG: hypothetical protein WDO14_05095 [Bacteroidota bacterium]